MITGEQVRVALKNRHSGESWSYFEELRTHTGATSYHGEKLGIIDAYAVGLWQNNRGFIAYELKQSRGDFMSDINNFAVKQAAAIRNSTQFYYVCPANLIRPDEVPEMSGLMWVDGGGTKVKKIASIRELNPNGLNPDFCRAMFRAQSGSQPKTLLWKYLGKEMTESDLVKLVSELGKSLGERDVAYLARKESAKIRQRSWETLKKFAEAINYRDLEGYSKNLSVDEVATRMVQAYKESKEVHFVAKNIMCNAKQIKKSADDLLQLVQKQETQGEIKDAT